MYERIRDDGKRVEDNELQQKAMRSNKSEVGQRTHENLRITARNQHKANLALQYAVTTYITLPIRAIQFRPNGTATPMYSL